MKAAVLRYGETIALEERPSPDPGPSAATSVSGASG